MPIRSAGSEDLPGILAIYNEVVATSTAIYAIEPSSLAERRAWFEERGARGYPVLVAAEGAEVLGFWSFGDWRGAWPAHGRAFGACPVGQARARPRAGSRRGPVSRRAGDGDARGD